MVKEECEIKIYTAQIDKTKSKSPGQTSTVCRKHETKSFIHEVASESIFKPELTVVFTKTASGP